MKRPSFLNPDFVAYVRSKGIGRKAANAVKWTAKQLYSIAVFALAIYGTAFFVTFIIQSGFAGLFVLASLIMFGMMIQGAAQLGEIARVNMKHQ